MKKTDDNKSVVLFPNQTGESKDDRWTIHQLPDPFSGELRSYWKSETSCLHELHSIHDDDRYCTYFLENNILASNKLHTATVVDPLFWLVYFGDTNKKSTTAWQPLDQLMQTLCGSYYTLLSSCLSDESQCQHIFATLRMDDSDEIYYKFCWKKTAAWLNKKQKRLLSTLCSRRQEQDKNNTGGAFVEGFVLGGGSENNAANADPLAHPTTTNDEDKPHPEDLASSYQLVGNYLSASSRERWMIESNLDGERFWGSVKHKKPKVSLEPEDMATLAGGEVGKTKTVKARPVTAGAKQLQKLNKRGMQKMSAFFSAKKKTTSSSK